MSENGVQQAKNMILLLAHECQSRCCCEGAIDVNDFHLQILELKRMYAKGDDVEED